MTLPVTENDTRVTRRRHAKCPACHRPFAYLREGTNLSPMKARLFDLIQDEPGISPHRLAELLYGRDDVGTCQFVRVHVSQLRKTLAGNGTRIMSAHASGYWFEQETNADVGS